MSDSAIPARDSPPSPQTEIFRAAAAELTERLRAAFSDRLVSVVLFGSVARGAARPNSDLDLLAVVRGLPRSQIERRRPIDADLDAIEARLQEKLPESYISLVLKTPESVNYGGPLFYDMTVPGEAELLIDGEGFMRGYLDRLKAKMEALGSRRLSYLGHPYWDLKPDFKPGDIIDL